MASHNIQQLFSIIRPEQVEQYLAGKGWQCARGPEDLLFTLRTGPDGEPRSLTLPADANHPRLRRLVPNIVFSLAVTYGREAIDIANEIADQQVTVIPAPGASNKGSTQVAGDASHLPTADTRPVRIELINGQPDKRLKLRSRVNSSTVELPAGESLHLTCKPGTDWRIVLLSDGELDLDPARTPEMALGYPTVVRQWPSRGWGVAEGLSHYLQSNIANLLSDDVAAEMNATPTAVAAWITDLVTEFTFMIGVDLKQVDLGVLYRASARLLMGVRQRFMAANRSQPVDSVVDLARVILGIGGQGVVADNTSLDGLAKILEIDNPSAPQRTVEWLSFNARGLPKI